EREGTVAALQRTLLVRGFSVAYGNIKEVHVQKQYIDHNQPDSWKIRLVRLVALGFMECPDVPCIYTHGPWRIPSGVSSHCRRQPIGQTGDATNSVPRSRRTHKLRLRALASMMMM
ncbi:hypothetical protein U9M48_009712, partial [Paspalum notatum var. saurae]